MQHFLENIILRAILPIPVMRGAMGINDIIDDVGISIS